MPGKDEIQLLKEQIETQRLRIVDLQNEVAALQPATLESHRKARDNDATTIAELRGQIRTLTKKLATVQP